MTHLQTPALIRFSSLPASRWRNDGGSTTEMVVAGDDGVFDWRLSLAEIERSGAFSTFPGIARVLTVVQGQGLTMVVDGTKHRPERYCPFHFPGNASTEASLPFGPVGVLNVMTREDALRAHVTVVKLTEGLVHRLTAEQVAVLVSGHAVATDGAAQTDLFLYDTVRGDQQHGLSVHGRGFLALISLEKLRYDSDLSANGHYVLR